MAVEVVIHQAELRAVLEHDTILNATLRARMEMVAKHARWIAPVGSLADGDEAPGTYRDSISAVKIPDGPGWRLQTTDNKAHWIEYGAAHMPRFSVLTRSMTVLSGGAFGSFGSAV